MQLGNRNYVLIPRPPFFRGKKRLLSRESGTTFSLATMMSGKDGKEGAKGNGSFVLLLGPCVFSSLFHHDLIKYCSAAHSDYSGKQTNTSTCMVVNAMSCLEAII